MFELGNIQKLYVDHKTNFGVYLTEDKKQIGKGSSCILLPGKQVPKEIGIGDEIEVFIYKDSSDRYIATTNRPKLTMGELAVLKVVEVNKIGAFLDWGLEKDLLLPYSEQIVKVKKGESFLVGLYIDKSERLCATMKIYDLLYTDSPYGKEDNVTGIVTGKNPEYGVFVAVDHKYHGLIQTKELTRDLRIGEEVEARVLSVREDGKLNLSLRKKGYIQMDIDGEKIMEKLKANEGFLPYHDKSDPELIRREFHMSKNEFKRAIGKLYRSHKILITEKGIRMTDEKK